MSKEFPEFISPLLFDCKLYDYTADKRAQSGIIQEKQKASNVVLGT